MVLKERLTTAPILLYPYFSISFILYTNASEDSIRFKLTQIQHGWEYAIVYVGQHFSDTEKKVLRHFTIVVDHQVLKWLMSLCDPTGRLAQKALTLFGYDFNIQ